MWDKKKSDVGLDTNDGIPCMDDGGELALAAVATDCCEAVSWRQVLMAVVHSI